MAGKKPAAAKTKKAKKPTKAAAVKTAPDLRVRTNLKRSFGLFKKHKKLVLKLTAIYAGLYFLFVRTITTLNLDETREIVNIIFGDGQETFISRLALTGTLFSESSNLDQVSGFMFSAIFLISSLAMVWLLRHFWARKRTTVKDAFYQGMYPLVPFLLVIGIMLVQLIPFSVGSFVMQTSFENGIAITFIEKLGVVGVFVAGTLLSAYWLAGSIVAAYVVTVPGMTPFRALEKAKELLKGQRFLVARKILLFLILTGIIMTALLLGVVYVIPDASIVFVTLLGITLLPWIHFYFYGLYRDILDAK